jgi:NAD(P)-dependent dehydrogenase (short-subunit alcohol dehydrogenase family)
MEQVALKIARAGGVAETALVDALDERAVDEHMDGVAAQAGSVDISFNAISHDDVHGKPLLEMPYEEFARPVTRAIQANFLTTRAAARQMTKRRSGVIMGITATTARHSIPQVGGTGVAFDAIESLYRQWAAELGPHGIRVVWLHTTGIPEALQEPGGQQPDYGTGRQMSGQEFIGWLTSKTMLGRLTTLADVGAMASFVASERAGALTATGVNLSCGSVPTR